MKINKPFLLNYIKTLMLSVVVVVFIMKFLLDRALPSPSRMIAYLIVISALIFIGYLIREKRKQLHSKNKENGGA